jgi:hypothetical protein
MVDRYALPLVNADTRVFVHIISTDGQHAEVLGAQEQAVRGAELHVSLRATDADPLALAPLVTEMLPNASVQVAG